MTLKGIIWLSWKGIHIPLPVYKRMGQSWKGKVWFHPFEAHRHGSTVCVSFGTVFGGDHYELPVPIDTEREVNDNLSFDYELVLE